MLGFLKKKKEINSPKIVDEIENAVYTHLKPYGFKKYGRTLHRFVSGDISQVINFQLGMKAHGMNGLLCVNLGIRVPECDVMERCFNSPNNKKYYHEYDCNIRSRLGIASAGEEIWYDLGKKPEKIIKSIIKELDEYVLPAYEVLNSREAILCRRRDYPLLDNMGLLILLDESMIYGHLGDIEKAKECFEKYYESQVDDYNDRMTNGRKHYLNKGERIYYMGQVITAEEDGYVTVYGASRSHIDYLDGLAEKLGLRLNTK